MSKGSILPDECAAQTDDGQGCCIQHRNDDAVILSEQVGRERQKDHKEQQGQIEPQQHARRADDRTEYAVMGNPIRPHHIKTEGIGEKGGTESKQDSQQSLIGG